MTSTCLVTGGAGFIGCAISATLPLHFARVVAMDNLHPQVHPTQSRPADLDERVEFVQADVTVPGDWDALLADVRPQTIVHLAAETGTGQSLTEASRHALVNVVGTTEMLDALVRRNALPERVVLTSSRAVYGEGAWADAEGRLTYPGQRSRAMLESGVWDFPGLVATPFNSHRVTPAPTSVYGSTKLAQEHILRSWCLAMNVTPVLFRLQNVYGPGQSLINPYTGIVSLFARRRSRATSFPSTRTARSSATWSSSTMSRRPSSRAHWPRPPVNSPTTSAQVRRQASCGSLTSRRPTTAHRNRRSTADSATAT